MKPDLKNICIAMLAFILVLTGCETANQNVQQRPAADPAAQGRQMLERVYESLLNDYVEPVHPHRLIVSAAQGIQSEYRDNILVQPVAGDIRVMSPVTRRVYTLDISITAARRALNDMYTYGVNTYGGGRPLQVAYAMANKMAADLDPHTSVLTPEALKEMQIGSTGKLTGIGVSITVKHKRVMVVSPIDGSPADRAGLQPGDVILKVDGRPVDTLITAVNAIRGPAGTIVALTLLRSESEAPFNLRLVRETINIKSVKHTVLDANIHYLRISHFGNDTAKAFAAALGNPDRTGAPLKGVVIDLRSNPGGLLDQSLTVADYFIPQGQLLTLKKRAAEQSQKFFARVDDLAQDVPVVVLVDSGSASGSEIMAGALRGHDRALLVGGVTFGKGSVQSILNLPGGYGLKFTIGYYELPGGRRINKTGLQPDIVLYSRPDALREKDLYDGAGAEKRKAGNTEDTAASQRAKLWHGHLDPALLMQDPGIGRAVNILKRTRSARLADLLAADLSIEPAAASSVSPGPQASTAVPASSPATAQPASVGIRPRLFVLTVGVSRYKEDRLSLSYAEKDANAIARALGSQGTTLFREVRTKVLLDEDVSRESIIAAMNTFLGRAVSSDVVLIFVAGHGVKRAATNTFYFLPHDSNFQNITTKGLRWSDFEEEIAALGTRVKNVILLLDTCQSGALQIGARGIGVTPDLSSAFDRKGTYVLAAASADEVAVESSSWGHGVFTHAILSGLKSGADYNGDQKVDILELFHYVEAMVADLTKGQQHPRFQMGGGSLPLYELPQ